MNQSTLIAACGMNCAICHAYLRETSKCPGCRAPNDKKPVTRTRCKIKTCKVFKSGNATYCYQCGAPATEVGGSKKILLLDEQKETMATPHSRRSGAFCVVGNSFPCDALRHLDKRYRTKYHMSMIDNLVSIKNSGMKKFLAAQKSRYTCSACGTTICVHKGECVSCGKKLSI